MDTAAKAFTSDLFDNAVALLVDDDPDILDSMEEFLKFRLPTIKFLVASSGQEAIQLLHEHRVDLLISDYRMPGMDGLELLGTAGEAFTDMARIMMTAHPDVDLATTALNQEHVEYFLIKPVDPDELAFAVGDTMWKHVRRRFRNEAADRAFTLVKTIVGAAALDKQLAYGRVNEPS